MFEERHRSLRRAGPWILLLAGMLAARSLWAAALPASVAGQPLPSLAPMLEKVTPAVVNIAARGRVRVPMSPLFSDPFFRRFFELPPRWREEQSLGSGVIIDADKGYIVTNNHVIAKAQEITVTLRDGRRMQAALVGADRATDVAVIKVPSGGLTAIPLADSDALRVGDFVVAIGNPFGLGQTVTSGIVSALGRSGLGIEGYEDFIQTDASINVGNSGGALVNLRGELVGINTAILAPGGGSVGIGFAIPSNMARDIMTQLVTHGKVRRGLLGVVTQELTAKLAEAFGIERAEGALVVGVAEGSPAETAGVEPGDIIVGINERRIRNAGDVDNAIGLLRLGRPVRLSVLREGRSLTLRAVLAERRQRVLSGTQLHPRLRGAVFGEIEPGNPLYGRIQGVLVLEAEPGNGAWQAGLRAGDVVTSANRGRVRSLADLERAIRSGGGVLMFGIRRGNASVFVMVN